MALVPAAAGGHGLAVGHPAKPVANTGRQQLQYGQWNSMLNVQVGLAALLSSRGLAWAHRSLRRSTRRRSRVVAQRAVATLAQEDFELVVGRRAIESGLPYKVVHFVRHSEAEVNAAGRAFPKDDPRKKAVRLDEKYLDSPLSAAGLEAAQKLRLGILEDAMPVPKVAAVAASPLTRALQTATEVFGLGEPDSPKLFVLEALREYCGKQYQPCDSRRHPSELAKVFPHADFAEVPAESDSLIGPGMVESAESADARISQLFKWLQSRPEDSIACVAHMQILTRIFATRLEPAGLDSFGGDYTNLEIRSVPISFLW
mmetsp:Transcript_4335/g.9420  ORF Transcript_4335/g.9420 Transcript_4335/m.9420 type:complete len:315 (+) Transcript_4335:79-1023(+)